MGIWWEWGKRTGFPGLQLDPIGSGSAGRIPGRLPRDREGRALLPPCEPPEEVARVDRRGDVASARDLSG